MLNDRVMPSRDVVAAQRFGFAPKIAKLEFLVAHHTWIGRPAGLVLAREIIDNEPFELVGLINNVMRDA